MAKKKGSNEPKLNYKTELRLARESGPARLYVLSGTEDYLREYFLSSLKKIVLPEGEDSFSFRRLNGPDIDAQTLREAVDAAPFLTERSFVEIREPDLNRQKESDELLDVFSDLPEYCTVVIVLKADYEPDGRLKLVKGLHKLARELEFEQQSQSALIEWISRRFAALGKSVDMETAQRLIFISGDLMNRLIPEIEKIAAYARGDKVTPEDVEAVANHIPEAVVFEMTELIAQKKNNSAMSVLSELLADKNNEPIMMLAVLGKQMRQLYAARLAVEKNLSTKYVMDVCSMKYDYIANKLITAARGFTLPQLKRAVELCAETDYRMKSSGADTRELLTETVLRIAAGEEHGSD